MGWNGAGQFGFIPVCGGLLVVPCQCREGLWFIPVCGESADGATPSGGPRSVHPRVSGVCAGLKGRFGMHSGSSPCVRGLPGEGRQGTDRRRFIPVCEGSASVPLSQRVPRRVHPRVSGVCGLRLVPESREAGSSPRVRGLRSDGEPEDEIIRFIPACPGSAPFLLSCRSSFPFHPRVSGVCALMTCQGLAWPGSSPGVRGLRPQDFGGQGGVGFIPACPGSAARARGGPCLRMVHPRVSGVCPFLRILFIRRFQNPLGNFSVRTHSVLWVGLA